MTQIIRVADLVAALKEQPQDARVTILVMDDGMPLESYIDDVSVTPNFGPGKVTLVGYTP